MKKIYMVISLFIAGIAQLFLSLILAVVTTANRNIIGGADLPTFLFVFFRENGGIYFALACLGVLFIIAAIVVGVMKKKLTFNIVNPVKAANLRDQFISSFVDTSHDLYHEHIERMHTYSDGEFYKGYLWEFLLDNQNYKYECNMEEACEYLKRQKNIYVMWDLFSNERVFDKSVFATKYEKNTIIEILASKVAHIIPKEWEEKSGCWFPEDIYCFDDSMSWYVIFTHEGWDNYSKPELNDDEYIRICFVKGCEK